MRQLSLIITLIFIYKSIYSQNLDNSPKKRTIVPTNPQVAELNKYIDFPVAEYTGIPQISVPIYNIQLKDFNYPISLSYHAAGVKLNDLGSNCGSGWSLNAAGSIAIQVNGILDEISGYGFNHPYYSAIKNGLLPTGVPATPISCDIIRNTGDLFSIYTEPDIKFIRDVLNNADDSQADLYSLNCPNFGFKFFQNELGNFVTQTASNYKIIRIVENSIIKGYEVIDESGNKFLFQSKEESSILNSSSCSVDEQLNATIRDLGRSYKLSKIITSNNEVIHFNYLPRPLSYVSNINYSRTKSIDPNSSDCSNGNVDNYLNVCTTTTTVTSEELYLQSIIVEKRLKIQFIYDNTARLDLLNSYALKNIIVTNDKESIISEHTFNYDYWSNRLFLKEINKNGVGKQLFEYDTTSELPNRFNHSIDHWGYYNGKINSVLFPKDEFNLFLDGANREPDFNFTRLGSLVKTIFPTGGYVKYKYEPNTYKTDANEKEFVKSIPTVLNSKENETTSISFSIPSNAIKYFITFNNTYDGTNFANDKCDIILSDESGFLRYFWGTKTNLALDLAPGNYTLKIVNIGNTYSATCSLYWFTQENIGNQNRFAGGLRIKEIEAYDHLTGKIIKNEFSYLIPNTNLSSGKITFTPNYLMENLLSKKIGVNGVMYLCKTLTQSAFSSLPINYNQGSCVNYEHVTLKFLGKKHTKYLVSTAKSHYGTTSQYTPPVVLYDWNNGKKLEENFYSESDILVKKIINTYSYIDFDPSQVDFIKGSTNNSLFYLIQPPTAFGGNGDPDCITAILSEVLLSLVNFRTYAIDHKLLSTTETNYSVLSSPSTITNLFFYDNPLNIRYTRTVTTNSKSEQITTFNFSALEKNNIQNIINLDAESAEAIDALVSKNKINDIIFSQSFKQNKLLNRNVIKYKNYGNNIIAPHIIQTQFANNPLDTKLLFGPYDAYGNLLEQQKANDVRQAYIYDYQFAYPIAEIINAGYNEVAYTSFEADGKGNFNFTGNAIASTNAPTGNKVYQLSSGAINYQGNSSQPFILSFWANNNAFILTVNGTTYQANNAIAGITHGGFTYYQWLINGNNQISIQTSNTDTYIDELRLYPQKAMIKTFTYKPLIGISSQTDTNGKTIYYEYDGFNRLKLSRDHNGQILKLYDYRYQANTND